MHKKSKKELYFVYAVNPQTGLHGGKIVTGKEKAKKLKAKYKNKGFKKVSYQNMKSMRIV